MRLRQSVYCIRCKKRHRRVWDDERCSCYEYCCCSSYGGCRCGGNLYTITTLKAWRSFDNQEEKLIHLSETFSSSRYET
jgi:hypothetical protein